jgi:carboxypeptidase D
LVSYISMKTFLPSSPSFSARFLQLKLIVYSQTFLAYLDTVAANCNYTDYMEKYVTYPPRGPLPLPGTSIEFDPGCDVWDEIIDAALLVNPGFNIYHIFDMVRGLL